LNSFSKPHPILILSLILGKEAASLAVKLQILSLLEEKGFGVSYCEERAASKITLSKFFP